VKAAAPANLAAPAKQQWCSVSNSKVGSNSSSASKGGSKDGSAIKIFSASKGGSASASELAKWAVMQWLQQEWRQRNNGGRGSNGNRGGSASKDGSSSKQ
jgi:hypothetical protein